MEARNLTCEYIPRNPADSLLYKVLAGHLETFIAEREAEGKGLPKHVIRELRDYLDCGIIQRGFLRCKCEDCGFERATPFSCRRRGFCPSCGAKRMAETAEHLVENLLPFADYRQWVVTLPFQLRCWVATNRRLMARVHRIISTEILSFYQGSTILESRHKAAGGFISFTHLFGSAIQLTPHFHMLFADGVFRQNTRSGRVAFGKRHSLTNEDVGRVLERIVTRVVRYLRRSGFLDKQGDLVDRPDIDPLFAEHPDLAKAADASIRMRIAFGPRAGKRVRRIGQSFGYEEEVPALKGHLIADMNGFTIHAARQVTKHQRGQLEGLINYMGRSSISSERLSLRSDGDLEYKMKRRFNDGSEKLILSPTELLEKLVAVIPEPRANLTRYGGVFAPAHAMRPATIRNPGVRKGFTPQQGPDGNKLVKLTAWARLLARVFQVDIGHCPECNGNMRIMAAVVDPLQVARYLRHVGIDADPPTIHPAKSRQLELIHEVADPP